MKKIKLGTFFGRDIYLETEENDVFDYEKKFRSYMRREREAVDITLRSDGLLKIDIEKDLN